MSSRRRRRVPVTSRMSLRVSELSIKVNGRTTLHARSLELTSQLCAAAGFPLLELGEHAQLELPSSATNVPACPECGAWNYHLVDCSIGGAR